jgi:mannitol/fructose-specific phosphotransferase system IIA component (Ntr-type)
MSTTLTHSQRLTTRSILLGLQAGDTSGLLQELVDGLAVNHPELEPRRAELLAAFKEREALGSTASQGVAIPHVKLPGLSQVAMVLGVHRRGVNFRALDNEPVHVFFSIVRPVETADQHLGLLRWCASIAQHEDFVSFTRQTQSAQEVLDLLNELAPA